MADNSVTDRLTAGPHDGEHWLQRFEEAWLKGTPLPLEQVLSAAFPDAPEPRRRLLAELVRTCAVAAGGS